MTTLHGIEVKVGDKVWDSAKGWGQVDSIHEHNIYPIRTDMGDYTQAGQYIKGQLSPRLFWQEFEIPAHAFEKPKVMVKKYIVLYQLANAFRTTSDNIQTRYYSSKNKFNEFNGNKNYIFISLIMESEIEVEE